VARKKKSDTVFVVFVQLWTLTHGMRTVHSQWWCWGWLAEVVVVAVALELLNCCYCWAGVCLSLQLLFLYIAAAGLITVSGQELCGKVRAHAAPDVRLHFEVLESQWWAPETTHHNKRKISQIPIKQTPISFLHNNYSCCGTHPLVFSMEQISWCCYSEFAE
jgi:hypothetical protein